MGVRDIVSGFGVKKPETLTLAAAGTATGAAMDTQGFERGLMYALDAVATMAITGITRSVQVATATVADASGLVNGQTVTVAGANQAEYNISAVITNVTGTTFDYTVAGSPTTPATGTITMTIDSRWALASAIATGSYNFTDSADDVTFAAVQADSVLPTRKQTANALVATTIDSDDSKIWQQPIGVFGNKRYVKPTITLTAIDAGSSITWSLTPILQAELTPFEDWDSTVTGDTKG